MSKGYDVVIIGAGPAGVLPALGLTRQRPDLKILITEKGPDIDRRVCPINVRGVKCTYCHPCCILCGWGGAGAFSDGKLTLTTEF
ncbi:MAG: lycopene cyclase family protein, partial [Actinobacteria bacterium]|nr:lycopene cyclase family protein [Actinomycetota bacterium]